MSAADAGLLFAWRNLPEIVALSGSGKQVTREEHESWFSARLARRPLCMWMIEHGGQPAGQIRVDPLPDGDHAITIYLVPGFTGRGLGTAAITLACKELLPHTGVRRLVARILPNNAASLHAFHKAGFAKLPGEHGGLVLMARANTPPAVDLASDADERATIQAYTELLARHGNDVRSLNWGSRASQEKRFEVLLSPGVPAGARILDVGCGLGDLCGWLERRGLEVDYHGIDLTPAMIERARLLHPRGRFEVCDLLREDAPPADIVVASGIFCTRQNDPWGYMQAMIRRMFGLSREFLAFNSLSTWFGSPDAGEFHADPVETLLLGRTLASRLSLHHHYHPRDFTMILYAQRQA